MQGSVTICEDPGMGGTAKGECMQSQSVNEHQIDPQDQPPRSQTDFSRSCLLGEPEPLWRDAQKLSAEEQKDAMDKASKRQEKMPVGARTKMNERLEVLNPEPLPPQDVCGRPHRDE